MREDTALQQKLTERKQKTKKKEILKNSTYSSTKQHNDQKALCDADDEDVGAEPCFIRRDAAVSIVDDVDPSDFDEVIAMKRVQSAGGTVSSQAIFKSDHAANV